jgi:chaperonin GroES
MTQQVEKHKLQLKPLSDRVICKRLEAEEVSKGGIILPDSAKQKQEKVEVLAVGEGKVDQNGNRVPMPVVVGDIVLMDKYAGQEVSIDSQELIIVRADDIVAKVEK